MKPRIKTLLICTAAIIFLCLLFIAFILPGIVKQKAVEEIEKATGRKASIGRITINPLTLTAGIYDFHLSEKGDSRVFASFSSVRLSASPASIFRRAAVISSVNIVSPSLHFTRTAPNRYNFSDLLEKKEPKKEEGPPLRFSVNNIVISHGSLDFDDRAAKQPLVHTVRDLELAVPFISNIPYLADRYVTPRFNALINGAPLTLTGKLKPFAASVETAVKLDLKKVDIPFYFAYLPAEFPFKPVAGRFNTDLNITYRISAARHPELTVGGTLDVAGLALQETNGAPLASINRLGLGINPSELISRRIDLGYLKIEDPELFLTRETNGKWNFQGNTGEKAVPPKETAEITAKKNPQAPKPTITLADFSLKSGKLHLKDQLQTGRFAIDLLDITIGASKISTIANSQAQWTLSLRSERGETASLAGTLTPEPFNVAAKADIKGIDLKPVYPYFAQFLTAPVSGTLDLSTKLAYSIPDGLKLEETDLALHNLATTFGGQDHLRLASLNLKKGSFEQKKRSLLIDSVEINGGSCRLSKLADSTLSPMRLLRQQQKAPAPASRATAASPSQSPPFSWRINRIDGRRLGVTFSDLSREEQPLFSLADFRFSLSSLAGPIAVSVPFSTSAVFNRSGSITAKGSFVQTPFKLNADIGLKRIPLRDFEPYFPADVNVTLAEGTLDTTTSLTLAMNKGKLTGSWRGNLGIRSFYCLDAEGDDLLKWESLQLDNVSGAMEPFTLAIGDVALNSVFARVIVGKDGTLNLQHLRGEEEAPAAPAETSKGAAPSTPAPATPPTTKAQGGGTNKISVGTLTIQDGTLDFTDRHLSTGFATTFYNLGGRVSGLTSDANKTASVDLRGSLENHSPLRITGSINPLRDNLFIDLKISFTDIELAPVTPYSGTYLGYSVDKGKLFLDLLYRIDNKALQAENKIFIDQFTFGNKVESEKATNLPVRLAVALLKDRKGEIHLDMPLSGRTDDPEFSVFKLVLQMLKNLLVKAATSPFALISSLMGGNEDFSALTFAPGSSRLSESEQDKLAKLAKALQDRPALNLEVSGYIDRERDAEGYRNELLLKKMKSEKFRSLVKARQNQPGQTQDNIEIAPAEQSTWLKAVYLREKFPKPRNMLGMVKDLPDPEMRKLIIANTSVGEEELKTLARERAEEVVRYLTEQGKIDPARLFQKGADIHQRPKKEGLVASRVEFGIIAK